MLETFKHWDFKLIIVRGISCLLELLIVLLSLFLC